jgi:hypothetical protein
VALVGVLAGAPTVTGRVALRQLPTMPARDRDRRGTVCRFASSELSGVVAQLKDGPFEAEL